MNNTQKAVQGDGSPSVSFLVILALGIVGALVGSLPGQCQQGQHPVGVASVAGTSAGCQEIDGTGRRVWFSMFVVPRESGGPWVFSYLNPAWVGPRPQEAVGWTAISTGVALPGVRVPGMGLGCDFHVPLDVLLPARVTLLAGCQTQFMFSLPPLPGLRGFQFYAQTWARDLTVGRDLVTGVIRVTVQP